MKFIGEMLESFKSSLMPAREAAEDKNGGRAGCCQWNVQGFIRQAYYISSRYRTVTEEDQKKKAIRQTYYIDTRKKHVQNEDNENRPPSLTRESPNSQAIERYSNS